VKQNPETIVVQVEKKSKQNDSSEVAPEHEEQEPIVFEAPEIRRLGHLTKRPSWHSDYVIESNVE